MFSKQQASQIRQEFWTAFGQYMSPISDAEGNKINWVNYKTGEKNIHFKMDVDNKKATIAISLTHPDKEIRALFFEQFVALKNLFNNTISEEWDWIENIQNDLGKTISKIEKRIDGVSVFKQEDWPTIIAFFKQRIIELDQFWSEVKYAFEALR